MNLYVAVLALLALPFVLGRVLRALDDQRWRTKLSKATANRYMTAEEREEFHGRGR